MCRMNSTPRSRMRSDMKGFTLIEVAVVLTIGGILLSMAMTGFGDVTNRMSVRSAVESFAAIQARARAHAIERGEMARLRIDPAGDSVWITTDAGRVDFLNFRESRDVDLQSETAGVITLCMNPRGYAEIECNSFKSEIALDFARSGESQRLLILPMGQLEW